ncbi:hypothetical protein D3C72_2258090 [compost metagenome]
MPVSRRKAFIGAIAGPRSRRPSTRQAMAKAKLPKVWCSTTPEYSGLGSDSIGNLPEADQSKVPPSTMMPPMELPWPPRNFVAECTTMSAPCSSGRSR